MQHLTGKRVLEKLITYREACFFFGLWLWITVIMGMEGSAANWKIFFRTFALLSLMMLPMIIFSLVKPLMQKTFSKRMFVLCWLLFFGGIVPGLALLGPGMGDREIPGWLFGACAICGIVLELLLVANDYYRKRIAGITWVRKLSLEKAVFIILVILAVMLSAMAVSSMDDPRFHSEERLLIGFVLNPSQIIRHFGMFCGMFMQFLVIYMAGYLIFLINSRFLVAVMLKKHGLIAYVLSMLTVVAILYPVLFQLLMILPINRLLGPIFTSNPFAAENAAGAVSIMILTLPVLLSQQWTRQNSQIVSLEKEKTQAELDLLKQQINPHFLFNTLNNLYSLSLHHSEKTPDSILQLSDLMRYVIYKGREEKVRLEEEIRYIEDFMDLQRMRLRQPLDLRFEQDIADPYQQIAPLLLIVFIENAFKHGIEPAEDAAFLHLMLKADPRELIFTCSNSFEKGNDKETGIGLDNLRKRLELLYPGKHRLHTEVKNHTFKAELQINFT
ncbi:sensor histidine kinase [Terrimonas sp. NA20]|uniref:Sensor histidine kinase n=1 Tax=Terrimonas ginsenosidimutans TaxID=2908004 RepID=A0ABS9KXH0_9BACT|nr:sensor histidine kinase [Terrimonas ginsenosidimutans]MCG2617005.1 sensor histidine kinase [Terrimonas ginsenosidimutans]